MRYAAMTMTRVSLLALVVALFAGCDDAAKPVATVPSNAGTTTAKTVEKRPASAIAVEITRLEKQIAERRKQAPRIFDQQKAKKLNSEIEALDKRLKAAKLELEEAQKAP